ncbi:MAG: hypothetical protein BMS9Abin29_2511 [Gemmatimonadota bacterium]|nr:MAG: hypothetical protein BMS9Abin29_2511 [Gemmatimonadota bacterium]
MAFQINTPRPGEALGREFGLRGRIRPQLEEFIVPTVQIADLSSLGLPSPTRRCSAAFYQPAVVAEAATWSIEMQPGSMAVLKSFFFRPTAADQIRAEFLQSVGVPGSLAASGFSDARLTVAGEIPWGQLLYGTAIPAIATEWRGAANTDGFVYQDPGWIVYNPIGGVNPVSIWFQSETINQAVRGGIEWVEYALES